MDKVIQLTTWERIQTKNILLMQPAGATFHDGNCGSDFLKAMTLTEKEKAEIDFVKLPGGGKWNSEKEREWTISLDVAVWRFAFDRLLNPKAIGWSFDRLRNEALKTKMDNALQEMLQSAQDAGVITR